MINIEVELMIQQCHPKINLASKTVFNLHCKLITFREFKAFFPAKISPLHNLPEEKKEKNIRAILQRYNLEFRLAGLATLIKSIVAGVVKLEVTVL